MLEKQIQELNYQIEDDQRSYEDALNAKDAQIRKMREECQALMVELQMLLDTKQVCLLIKFGLAWLNQFIKSFDFLNLKAFIFDLDFNSLISP